MHSSSIYMYRNALAFGLAHLLLGLQIANANYAIDEQRYERIAGQLRCVVCQGQSVLESEADAAKDFKAIVRHKLAQGASDTEILDFFAQRYGDFVLLKPRATEQTAPLWAIPLLVAIGGGAVLFRRKRS